jgi:hypothetical protein
VAEFAPEDECAAEESRRRDHRDRDAGDVAPDLRNRPACVSTLWISLEVSMMSTAEAKSVPATKIATGAPSSPAPATQLLPPAGQPELYWGDWIAVRLWFLGMIVMAAIAILDFVVGVLRN